MVPKKLTMKFKNPYIHGTLSIEKNTTKRYWKL